MNDYIQKVLEDHLKDWNGRELRGSCRAGNRRSNAGTVKCAIPSAYPMRIITKSRHVMRAELWRQFGIGMVILVFSVGCATQMGNCRVYSYRRASIGFNREALCAG